MQLKDRGEQVLAGFESIEKRLASIEKRLTALEGTAKKTPASPLAHERDRKTTAGEAAHDRARAKAKRRELGAPAHAQAERRGHDLEPHRRRPGDLAVELERQRPAPSTVSAAPRSTSTRGWPTWPPL